MLEHNEKKLVVLKNAIIYYNYMTMNKTRDHISVVTITIITNQPLLVPASISAKGGR